MLASAAAYLITQAFIQGISFPSKTIYKTHLAGISTSITSHNTSKRLYLKNNTLYFSRLGMVLYSSECSTVNFLRRYYI